jgi:hypothetical protein
LFFDRKRPKRVEGWHVDGTAVQRLVHVGRVRPEKNACRAIRLRQVLGRVRNARRQKKVPSQKEVIKRENAQGAAAIEIAPVVPTAAGIEENAADEEPGQHEEKRDAGPSRSRHTHEHPANAGLASVLATVND